MSPLGVAIVGCGQIADAHLAQIARASRGRTVAVCDTEPELAEQAADRFAVPRRTTDLDELLSWGEVDVIHLCTPVRSHAPLTIRCLQAGKHVYTEKPFTVDATEARRVVEVAEATGQRLCLGHDQLFDPIWQRAAAQIDKGRIGTPVHIESVLGYPIGGAFGREVAADARHWVRSLPGGLFQNTLSHPLYRLTEYLPGEVHLDAHWHRRSDALDIPTELRIQLWDDQTTAAVTFLSRAKPPARATRFYGTAGSLEVDFDSQTIRFTPPSALPGAFEKLQRPLGHLTEAIGNTARACWNFARGDIHYFAGMRNLFEAFYEHIQTGGPPPIELAEMVRVTEIMDRVFASAAAKDERTQDRTSDQPAAIGAAQSAPAPLPIATGRRTAEVAR